MESAELGGKIGILGGGQLARMLVLAAQAMGFETVVLATSASEPAAQVCRNAIYGPWENPEVLARFLSQCPVILFENEFIRTEALEVAASKLARPPRFRPSLAAIREMQNKLRQKRLLKRLGVATAETIAFSGIHGPQEIKEWIDSVRKHFSGALVLKWAELGYDGKGTWIAPESWTRKTAGEAADFVHLALSQGVEVFAEQKIRFRRELAIVGCASISGEFKAFPLVITEQAKGICRRVLGPASAFGISAELEEQAVLAAQSIARELPLHGCFAIEFFETENGELLVNELAPRVHNSGHVTQNACATSQFENHIRAALGISLGDTKASVAAFGMLNFIGTELTVNFNGGLALEAGLAFPPVPEGAHFHWYGKTELRLGRKMGHWNLVASSIAELHERLDQLEGDLQEWPKKKV